MQFSGLTNRHLRSMSPAARLLAKEAGGARRQVSIAFVLTTLAIAAALGIWAFAATQQTFAPVLAFIFPFAILIVRAFHEEFMQVRRSARPRRLAVWLRRFHQDGDDRFPMALLFDELSEWGVLACTLSDDTVAHSEDAEGFIRRRARNEVGARYWGRRRYTTKTTWSSFIVGVGATLALITFWGVAGVATERFFPGYGWVPFVATFFLPIIPLSIFAVIRSRTEMRTRGEQTLRDALVVDTNRASEYFQRLNSNLDAQREALDEGFLALHVQDVDWQNVVAAALGSADVVLIDVSEISSNVDWELHRLQEHQGKIVFALGVEQQSDLEGNGWKAHHSCKRLEDLFGTSWSERNQVFLYPQKVARKKHMSVARRFMPNFTIKIYEAIAA